MGGGFNFSASRAPCGSLCGTMASLRGSEVVHVPNNAALAPARFEPGITPGSPPFQRAALGPLAGPLGEALSGVLGGLAGGAIGQALGDDRPGEAEAMGGQGACVQHLHVCCGAGGHAPHHHGYGDEAECDCALDEGDLY